MKSFCLPAIRNTAITLALTLSCVSVSNLLATSSHAEEQNTLRVAVVHTPDFSGLMAMLTEKFEKESGIEVEYQSTGNPYELAKQGKADLVISHYGKSGLQDFVEAGLGHWPHMLFANQAVIIGPKSDPAGIRGLSAEQAYLKLAASKQPFIANQLPGPVFIDKYLQAKTGVSTPLSARSTVQTAKAQAARRAEKQQAYFIWGGLPFLRYAQKHGSSLEILVTDDPVLHRVMASTVVKADKISGVSEAKASAFEQFLIRPDVQAEIANFRSMNDTRQWWWPYGRHN